MKKVSHFIDGKTYTDEKSRKGPIFNPAIGEQIAEVELASKTTVEMAIELNTERIVTFSYAHVPSILPRQKILENIGFPSSKEKALMYENSYELFMKAGYVSIGMDHFSRPGDEFDIALQNKQLHRNFQGYCTRETTGQVYGFGASSISQLDSAYSQNIKNAAQYINAIEKNNLAVLRGYEVDIKQKIVANGQDAFDMQIFRL